MVDNISIVGAGIGGLSMALTLKKRDFNVTIYESAPAIKPVGAGIIMANNAMQIFRELGIQDSIEKVGNKVSVASITNENLRPLSVVELTPYEKKYGVYNVAIHRGELQKILAEEIGYENIRLSKRLSNIRQSDMVELHFSDDSIEYSPIVIGADGIKSTVRDQLFQASEIRQTKQVCWRGISTITLPAQYQHQAIEAWGKGKRFGFVKISDKKIYWYAVANEDLVSQDTQDILRLFEEFHPDISKIILETDSTDIIFSRISDLRPMKKWHTKNVCLIGDAAHATTPNLGQGACQAVEDAYVLAQCYHPGKPVEKVFAEYEKIRLRKAHHIVNTSRVLGEVAHIENSFAVWLRNALLRSVPNVVNNRQLKKIFDLEYL